MAMAQNIVLPSPNTNTLIFIFFFICFQFFAGNNKAVKTVSGFPSDPQDVGSGVKRKHAHLFPIQSLYTHSLVGNLSPFPSAVFGDDKITGLCRFHCAFSPLTL